MGLEVLIPLGRGPEDIGLHGCCGCPLHLSLDQEPELPGLCCCRWIESSARALGHRVGAGASRWVPVTFSLAQTLAERAEYSRV